MEIFNIKQQYLIKNLVENNERLFSEENTSKFSRHKINLAILVCINLAKLICYLIPVRCPFERNLHLWGKFIHIRPICQFNPLYQNFMKLRWRAEDFLQNVGMQNI